MFEFLVHYTEPIGCLDKFPDRPIISPVSEKALKEISLDQFLLEATKERLMKNPDDIYLVNADTNRRIDLNTYSGPWNKIRDSCM